MKDKLPFVSIIIPCRNEEKHIDKCLESVVSNDYPRDKLEVLVVDGMSVDSTREKVMKYVQLHDWIKLLDNPKKIVPSAMNAGIMNARGDIIIRLDAHSYYDTSYVTKCVKYLSEYDADNVGGIWITLAGDDTLTAHAIAQALSHPFGVGNAHFRIGTKGAREVDTVPFGCYKKEVFDKIGLFNENLVRSQDFEINVRLKRKGGRIILVPDITSYYYARSTLKALATNNFWNGFWVIYSNKYAKLPFSLRHLIPFFFVLSLIVGLSLSQIYRPALYLFVGNLAAYLCVNLFFSFKLSLMLGLKYLPALIMTFTTLHFSYGFGSLWGIIRLIKSKKV